MVVSLLRNTLASNPKMDKKMVGWSTLKQHHLAGLLRVGTTIGVGLQLLMLGWCRTSMTTINSPRTKLISKKRFTQCSRKQLSFGIPSCIMTNLVIVGCLLLLTHQNTVLLPLEIPLTNHLFGNYSTIIWKLPIISMSIKTWSLKLKINLIN